ncbi:PREDICTED: uncharacterized GPI-anchored protein At3g06035 [Nelumbo nucifera]|uniref:Uncharacterized GPI-anchored protein At3g06035 n=2 Tax=Nelumbo nucifera TaxID=4432 RepID=A0A1U8BDS4_NELNU|nr:PREDICTED: uncharacterized GPI-anchored protein At3g06035 [Nelumbo nucifera]DAD33608.1 TPA_asm: hypothetical protein HUJ06_012459 [Nelumbo nucifera]
MASPRCHLLVLLLLQLMLLLFHPVKSHDEEETLLRDINKYRASLNLSPLTENKDADCIAEQVADQFEKQPCSNTTGANSAPGAEIQLANYPAILHQCHLNTINTKDVAIIPACVPNLVPTLVLSNFTGSHYSRYLKDSKYTEAGISAEDDWIVVVLTTNAPVAAAGTAVGGNSVPRNPTNSASKAGPSSHLLSLFLVLVLVLFS